MEATRHRFGNPRFLAVGSKGTAALHEGSASNRHQCQAAQRPHARTSPTGCEVLLLLVPHEATSTPISLSEV